MWISDPTPVISNTKHMDNWSICSPRSTWSWPTGIQVNSFWWMARSSPVRPSMSASSVAPTPNAATAVAQPSRWPHASVRLPPNSKIAAPANGSATSSQVKCVILALSAFE